MKKETPDIENLLIRYYDNMLSDEEFLRVENWINRSPANRKTAEDVYRICYTLETVSSRSGKKSAYAEIEKKIRAKKRKDVFKYLQRVAAAIAIPLMFVSFYLLSVINRQDSATIELSTTTGMISSVILPDSSKVWLNSNSSIRYPAKFRGKERRVELSGEAFFDITENKRSKFIVNAKNTEVEVYGTEFNVEAYPEDEIIRTTLISGSVGFRYDAPGQQRLTARMVPNQMVRYNTTQQSLHLDPVDAAVNSSWKDGKIVLRDTSLADALRMLGNKYNVSFVILNKKLTDNTYMGTFTNQNLDVILKHFSMSSEIHFREIPTGPGEEVRGRKVIEVF